MAKGPESYDCRKFYNDKSNLHKFLWLPVVNLDRELRTKEMILRNPKLVKALCAKNTYDKSLHIGFGICNDKILRQAEIEVIRFLNPNLNSQSRTRDFMGIKPGNVIKSWNISERKKGKFKSQLENERLKWEGYRSFENMIYKITNKKGTIEKIEEELRKMMYECYGMVKKKFYDIVNTYTDTTTSDSGLMNILPNVTKSYLGILRKSPMNNCINKILRGKFSPPIKRIINSKELPKIFEEARKCLNNHDYLIFSHNIKLAQLNGKTLFLRNGKIEFEIYEKSDKELINEVIDVTNKICSPLIKKLYYGTPNIKGTLKRKKAPDIVSLSKKKIDECKCEKI